MMHKTGDGIRYFERSRESLGGFIDDFLNSKKSEFARVNAWGGDVLKKFQHFVKTGKMLRGGLVMLGYQMCGRRISRTVLRAAAAVEFIQAALLIHDDIIDRDSLRRGTPSVHFQYARQGRRRGVAEPEHYGEGMGICAGDIGFFLAFELFSGLKVESELRNPMAEMWSRELCYVGLAQMQDLHLGSSETRTSAQDILDLYLYKTARYSFSTPLITGWVLGGGSPAMRPGLEMFGEHMGLLFQLRDDELGLFGSPSQLGKPVGSDIRENKKTLYRWHLFRKACPEDRKRLSRIFGNPDVDREMVVEVRAMLDRYGIRDEVQDNVIQLRHPAEKAIAGLNIRERHRHILTELLDFNSRRTK
jgi:geranylgeranyl diphosphate synthase type I